MPGQLFSNNTNHSKSMPGQLFSEFYITFLRSCQVSMTAFSKENTKIKYYYARSAILEQYKPF